MAGKFQQAWTQFTTAIDQDPRCQAAYEGRAIVNLQMSNLFGALQDVNASIKVKQSAELHTNRGVINLVRASLLRSCLNVRLRFVILAGVSNYVPGLYILWPVDLPV